jgi:hypothetical protein
MQRRWRDLGRWKMLPAVFAVAGLVALASAAGFARADPSANDGYKVAICHQGQTIVIAHAAEPAHLAHGDTEGPC